jgi:hypothetical protein
MAGERIAVHIVVTYQPKGPYFIEPRVERDPIPIRLLRSLAC